MRILRIIIVLGGVVSGASLRAYGRGRAMCIRRLTGDLIFAAPRMGSR
jgi:hypothetical protein